MAETLSIALERKWDAKLYNWSLWYVGSGTGACAATSAYERLSEGDFKADGGARTWESYTSDPTAIVGEALDTNALLLQLESKLYDSVRAWYCWTGTEEQRAADLRIPRTTLQSRVAAAKLELERLDGLRRRMATKPPHYVP